MNRFTRKLLAGMVWCSAAALAACTGNGGGAESPGPGMANPASRHCIDKGGKLVIEKDAQGNEVGMCHLPDGSVVDEWKLFRRDHARPAESVSVP